jgi:predicted nucleic acid-binding protein
MPVERILIDTCVLYPTVMREMVIGVARAGAFEPVWSDRILTEWALAARKLGPAGAAQAEAEIALLKAGWPQALKPAAPGEERRLWLPDPDDIHVLAVAVSAGADRIMTLNAKDFPRNTLGEEGLDRVDPDSYLHALWLQQPELVAEVAAKVLAEARRLSGEEWDLRPLLKKARLPRTAKALSA